MIVRLPMGGFILPHPALGFGGRPASRVLASPAPVSGALASIEAPPAPPVPVVPPPVVVAAPVLEEEDEVALADVVGPPLVEVFAPPEAPDDPVVAPCVPAAGEDESEHAAAAAQPIPRTTAPKRFRIP
jgi:hypothetical protein